MKRDGDDDENGWDFGDAWKQSAPDAEASEEEIEYVEILRGDTGQGYDETRMLEYVMYLGSLGIEATFDAFPLREIKIYVLKVEAGRVDEAKEALRTRFSS
jgi:hypothetical protein